MLNGSPHEKGCTFTALREVEKALNAEGIDTEIVWLSNKPIAGCMGCKTCATTGKCTFDDLVNVFLKKAQQSDGFVFGSPVHYASATGAITAFLDRVFYCDSQAKMKSFYLKPTAAISSARRAGNTSALDQLNKYFSISEMPVISSRYWNMVFGSKPEDVLKDEEGLQIMRVLGKNIAFFLKCQDVALKNGVIKPTPEEKTYTNFIK